jgi:hypothetical protein
MEDGYYLSFLIICIPVAPGRSRIMIGSTLPPLPSWIQWLAHAFTNRFLDSDIWIHDQEMYVRGQTNSYFPAQVPGPRYTLPTESDNGPRLYRLWWSKHLSTSPVFGAADAGLLRWLSKAEQRDRYENHIKNCQHCRSALERIRQVKRWSPMVALAGLLLCRSMAQRLAVGVLYGGVAYLSSKVEKMITGPTIEDKVSAAQF